MSISPDSVKQAYDRISPYINRTPLLTSSLLNESVGHELIFKAESFQKIGAFKIRGALNALLTLKEADALPKEIVAFSSGNHAQAVALAARMFGVEATIFMTKTVSGIKKRATESYGAKVILTESRQEAEDRTRQMAENGAYFIHPFDNDMVIAGQGTACYEAFIDGANPTAIFATCGGGGLLSGTYLAANLFDSDAQVFAGEPANANDAARSYKSGTIHRLSEAPKTIADGAATPSISERTFCYLKKLKGFYEISEEDIILWTQRLTHFLKVVTEPTSAVAMAAAAKWLETQKQKQRVLVILSGGNIAPETQRIIWEKNFLS